MESQHNFSLTYINESCTCTGCGEQIVDNLKKQGYRCRDCRLPVHKGCKNKITVPCPFASNTGVVATEVPKATELIVTRARAANRTVLTNNIYRHSAENFQISLISASELSLKRKVTRKITLGNNRLSTPILLDKGITLDLRLAGKIEGPPKIQTSSSKILLRPTGYFSRSISEENSNLAIPMIFKIFSETGIAHNEIWKGTEDVITVIRHFSKNLKLIPDKGKAAIEVKIPSGSGDLSVSRVYYVERMMKIQKIIEMITKKENTKWDYVRLSTRAGVPLHSHLTLAHYGLGPLFQNWKLSFVPVDDVSLLLVDDESGSVRKRRTGGLARSPIRRKEKFWGMEKLGITNYGQANKFMCSCFAWLEKNNDKETEGIFRKAGHEVRLQQLKKECARSDWFPSEEEDVHDIATLVKRFLREMEEPLLTYDLYSTFIGTDSYDGPEEKLSNLSKALLLLPKFNSLLLETLARYLNRLCPYSNQTKMNASNLAIVFGPNILKPRVENPMVLISDAVHVSDITQLVIENVDILFSRKDAVLEGVAEKIFRQHMRRKYSWHRMVSHRFFEASDLLENINESSYSNTCVVSKQICQEVTKHLQKENPCEGGELLEEKIEHEGLQDVPLLLAFLGNTLIPFKFQRVMLTPNHTPEFILESLMEEFGITDVCADQLALFTFDNDRLEPDVPLIEYGFGGSSLFFYHLVLLISLPHPSSPFSPFPQPPILTPILFVCNL
eukprot:TRINITY_DN7334_c0_g1_i3.p1 TRINITY_DN7334_c0_g1~~TRINITY_DN7334_c0_g1_i3.p1  ORF type:complete len:728 (-),score=137.89 TRINITY_DN7334_c0_g1_i3:479-2662(-)